MPLVVAVGGVELWQTAAVRTADDAPEPAPESWLDPRVVVGPSSIEGLGLFAAQPIADNELVAILGGRVIGDLEVRAKIAAGNRYDGIALGKDRNLTIEPAGWPGRHGNHSCDPNLWMAGSFSVVAAHDIAAGEELTIDYALQTTDPGWRMRCRCRSPRCRETIHGDDWRSPELQARYRGHWPPVIETLIGRSTRSSEVETGVEQR